jgi:hypothetical protein
MSSRYYTAREMRDALAIIADGLAAVDRCLTDIMVKGDPEQHDIHEIRDVVAGLRAEVERLEGA